MAFCVIYGFQDFPAELVPFVTGELVLGCADALAAGEPGFVDFDQTRSPFNDLRARLRNGESDIIWSCALSVDGNGNRTNPGQCGGGPEWAMLGRSKRRPDLENSRRSINFIRLVVNKVSVSTNANMNSAEWNVVWQFWSGTPRYLGGGEQADIDGFLSFAHPLEKTIKLPADSSAFNVTLFYGPSIVPQSFRATINDQPIAGFTPVANTSETVSVPLLPGRNMLRLSVDGLTNGTTKTDRDRFVFIVQ